MCEVLCADEQTLFQGPFMSHICHSFCNIWEYVYICTSVVTALVSLAFSRTEASFFDFLTNVILHLLLLVELLGLPGSGEKNPCCYLVGEFFGSIRIYMTRLY